MEDSYSNLQRAWLSIAEEAPEDSLLKIQVPGSVRVLSYKLQSFFKRASRIANALRNELGLEEGARIVILVDDANDLALLLHGAWLARMVACPIDCSLSSKIVSKFIDQTKAQVVAFSPDASAKIASLFVKVKSVEHWLVTGGTNFFGSSGEVRRLEELIANVTSGLNPDLIIDQDCQALTLLSPGSSGQNRMMLFSQKQLVNCAEAMLDQYPDNYEDEHLSWVSYPWKSFQGILHNFLMPLFTGVPALLNGELELRRFWDHVRSDGFTFAVLDQDDLRIICRRGKSRRWIRPKLFHILLYTKTALSSDLLSRFSKLFELPLATCYHHTEAGGLITVVPRKQADNYLSQWFDSYNVSAAGIPLKNTDFRICNSEGQEVEPEVIGEIYAKSSAAMTSYLEKYKSGSYRDADSYFHTGDDGFYVLDEAGNKNLFVMGRREDLILRDDIWIVPDQVENALLDIKGVEFGRVVGFPNLAVGHEIGAYVVLLRASNLNEEEIVRRLSRRLEWYECPKVVVIGKKPAAGRPYPSRKELEKHFEQYFGIDYSRG